MEARFYWLPCRCAFIREWADLWLSKVASRLGRWGLVPTFMLSVLNGGLAFLRARID